MLALINFAAGAETGEREVTMSDTVDGGPAPAFPVSAVLPRRKDGTQPRARTRRPTSARRKELIAAAAQLFSTRGYYAVTVDDICDALGLTGPALYRHFRSKEALLVAVFDQVIERQSERIRMVLDAAPDAASALEGMVRLHVEFATSQRVNLAVWRQEFHNLPEVDNLRLRRAQRLYLEECVHIVQETRPDLNDAEARALVHGIIALLQSPADFVSGIAPELLTNLLLSMALAAVRQATTEERGREVHLHPEPDLRPLAETRGS